LTRGAHPDYAARDIGPLELYFPAGIANMTKYVCALAVALLAAVAASAQTEPGRIAGVESQTPKNGMTAQYEQGRKQKADWHKQQKDPSPLYVFETLTGENTGTYLVCRFDLHWADMDKPPIPDASDTEEYNKVVGSYVQSITDRYYEFDPKMSNADPASNGPAKYTEFITFHVKRDKITEFRSALERVSEGAKKSNWPNHFEFYELDFGGRVGTFVLAEAHPNWSDFEEKPGAKPLRHMLEEAFGAAEADAIYGRLIGAVESEDAEILQYRPDLSYVPAK
jgi:hypothetical protein